MLEEFLKRLGSAIGKTYTPEEFGEIVEEAEIALFAKREEALFPKHEEMDAPQGVEGELEHEALLVDAETVQADPEVTDAKPKKKKN